MWKNWITHTLLLGIEIATAILENIVAVSCNTLHNYMYYQNQEIDTGTVYRVYLDFTSFICSHLCCMWFCEIFISCVD